MNTEGTFPPEKTICKWRWSYPVIHVSRGEVRTCDKPYNIQLTEQDFELHGTDAFINNPYLMERRREKLHGMRHKDCFTCIKLEDRGMPSSRSGVEPFVNYMNRTVGIPGDFEAMKYKDDERLLRADHPDILEISLSNLCNLKCLYCGPAFSSSWEREEVEHGHMALAETETRAHSTPPSFHKYFWAWFEKIHLSLDRVIFIGGEPLLNPQFTDYVQRIEAIMTASKRRGLRNFDKHPFRFHVISNFSVNDERFDRFLNLLPTLTENHHVVLEASCESFGPRAEYIRYGMNWDRFVHNVDRVLAVDSPRLQFGLQMAINALCVTSLTELLEWMFDLQNKHHTFIDCKENIVVAPEHLSPYVLTPDFALNLRKSIKFVEKTFANPKFSFYDPRFGKETHLRWQPYLRFMTGVRNEILAAPHHHSLRAQLHEFIREMDRRRGTNFLMTFPEYAGFMDHCAASRAKVT